MTANPRFALDIIERVIVAACTVSMAWTFLSAWYDSGNFLDLILLASEGSVVAFVLIRRLTGDVSLRPADWLVALLGVSLPLLVEPTGGALLPAVVCGPLMLVGFATQISAKFTLRRSFGVVAANRGVKIGGPYRLIRHPMYAGYLLTHIGFLLLHPSAWNAAVYTIALAFQIGRIRAEERLLRCDGNYQDFATAVPYRLVPRVF